MKVSTIIGARPQFIKAATVSRAISEYNKKNPVNIIEEIIIHTGQHYDDGMSAVFFRELEIPVPKYNLEVGSGQHGWQTGRMLAAIEKILLVEKPDWVVIYGDTNSTLAGALAAAKLHIRIAHVEAGLRSFNRRMPEEINRVISDQLSELLLCPSPSSMNNLAAEGIAEGIVMIGDVMADALQFAAHKAEAVSNILSLLQLRPREYLLATVHRAENTDEKERLDNILSAFAALNETVVFPVHPRTRKLIEKEQYHPENVRMIDPLGYFDIVALEKSARLLLTDSGGMQKEAYWLEVPCITLRDETEWIETWKLGWNILAGADRGRIIEAVRSFRVPSDHPQLYGDGNAARYCVDALVENS